MPRQRKLSDYPINMSPADNNRIPVIVENNDGSFSNATVPYSVIKPNKANVGLGNVDNTSDINKPVSNPVRQALDELLNRMYPIGSIYTNASDDRNPSVLMGFGTWQKYGEGRVLVGQNPNDTDFKTAGGTGGSKLHLHHGYGNGAYDKKGDLRAAIGAPAGDANRVGYEAISPINPSTGADSGLRFDYAVGGSMLAQTGKSHYTKVYGYTSESSTLQPYITVFMWRRIS
nr:MAG TPA: Baseplate wedge protein [Caudoviricetes sp.]